MIQAPSCVVILTHSDADSDEKFIQSLRYRADLIMKVDGFASGYSKDIDGEVSTLSIVLLSYHILIVLSS